MPTDIEGEPLWHDTIVGPANTDDIDGASVCDGFTLLQDNIRWLNTRIEPILFTGDVVIGDISDTLDHDYAFLDSEAEPPTFTVEAWHPNATVQIAAQLAPVQIADIYTLQLILYLDGSPVHVGPINQLDGTSFGCASSVLAYFTGVDANTYEIRLRVRDVNGAGHTSKGYLTVMSGQRIGGHTT